MERNGPSGRVTKSPGQNDRKKREVVRASTGNVDRAGDIVNELTRRIGTSADPGRYLEKPGLDDRMRAAGQDVGVMRRLLGCAS